MIFLSDKQRAWLEFVKEDKLLLKYLRQPQFPNFTEGLNVDELFRNSNVWDTGDIKLWLNGVLESNYYEDNDTTWINSIRELYLNEKKIT